MKQRVAVYRRIINPVLNEGCAGCWPRCPYCGAVNESGVDYCHRCGKSC